MLIFNFSPFPILNTQRLILKRITKADAEEIYILRTDKEITAYLDRDPPKSMDEIFEWVKKVDGEIDDNRGISWGIYFKGESKLLGTIGLWRTIPEHHRAEIGYSLIRTYQRKGIMYEAMIEVLKYGFEEMKLHTVMANVNPLNEPSIGVLTKAGFVKEAHFKEDYFYNGKFTDSAIYCLLDRNFNDKPNYKEF